MVITRRLATATIIACLAPTVSHAQNSAGDARLFLQLVNDYRRAGGLSPLALDQRATRAAQQHVNAMASANSVSHDVNGGFDARMNGNGIRGFAAENVAGGHRDVAAAFADWRSSALHDGNMLNPRARKMGLARVQGSDGRNYWALVLTAN